MMDVAAVRDCIGTKRFVWIDDDFNDTPEQLAKMLVENEDVARRCGAPDIDALLDGYADDPDAVRHDIAQHLTDLGGDGLAAVKSRFFEERVAMGRSGPEFGAATVAAVCETLGIDIGDRHPFDEGIDAVRTLCGSDDEHVGYIVDLNDAVDGDRRGLDVLRLLAQSGSKGTAFILTHDATIEQEADKEAELGDELRQGAGDRIDVPVCVIAKQRLFGDADADQVEGALAVALKRAGLRKCMHQVLRKARDHVLAEFDKASADLLRIPPEVLDAFVVERGYAEGMSELHVVERALTAHMSMSLRRLFGTHVDVRARADTMRRLRDVDLPLSDPPIDSRLEAFREAEIWESEDLINAGLAPIACGDVFESDADELAANIKTRRFLLLGQPCDVSLRHDGNRDQEATFLIPMAEREAGVPEKPKETSFPFTIAGKVWVCNLRNATMARLAVLDLASFRTDGRVRIDAGHGAPAELLPGQTAVYARRTAAAGKAIATPPVRGPKGGPPPPIDPDLQLTLARDGDFKSFHVGTYAAAGDGRPARVTWRLRRVGRVRMPFAAGMLEALTGVMSRRAFDLDYARAKKGAATQAAKPDAQAVKPAEVVSQGLDDAEAAKSNQDEG